MGTSSMSPEQAAQQARDANVFASKLIAAKSQRMLQQVFSVTQDPRNGNNVINVIPRMVGMIMGFYIQVTATLNNTTGGAVAITPTDFGAANLLSQLQFTDLNNLVRIQTSGYHINFLNSIKGHWPYGAALLNNTLDGIDVSGAYGSNWTVINEPASIADAAAGTISMWYYVPLAYSDGDYRGAVFANVNNATMQLQLTVNANPVGASTADTTNNIYKAAAGAGNISSVTVTVFQDYLDQLPMGNGQFILPMLSLSTIYELKYTTFSAITAGTDFPMQFPNFRDFLSTFLIYNSNPAVAGGRGVGADLNYLALQAANLTNIFKLPPSLVALRSRQLLRTDFPKGVYYFGYRNRPIATTQYGNMQLVLNAITAAAGAYAVVCWEDMGLQNVITQAGSLPAS